MSDTQYYVDQNGHQYYLDQAGQPVYIDPVQPVQPAAPVQQQPAPQPQAVVQPAAVQQSVVQQPLQAEPSVSNSFAPPEDYGNAQAKADMPAPHAVSNNAYAEQYGAEAAPAKSKLPMILALVGSIGVGGGAAYVYNSGGDISKVAAGIPLIKASSQDAKFKPENSGGKVFQNTKKHIYDRLEGKRATGNESLRAKAESPAQATINKASAARTQAQKHVKTARTMTGGAPTSVKTYVVLPDGRVIKPGSNTAPAKPVTAAPQKVIKTVKTKPVGDQRLFVNKATNVGAALRGAAPKRAASTVSKNGQFRYKPRRVASTDATQVPAAPRASNTISSGDFLLQLAARRSEAGAMEAFNKLKAQYSSILGSYTSDIQKADLGAKGTYYRIRVGPIESRSAAMDVCQQLKDAGGDCLIRQK